MSKDRIGPDGNPQGIPRKQIPLFGWAVIGFIALVLAASAFYFTHHAYEHVAQDKYLGPGQCKGCHPRQFESWAKTRMAGSFSVLRPGERAQEKRSAGLDPAADYTHNEACLPCHTTGLGRVGGFVSIETTPDLAGVTCESCHGPGGAYAGGMMSPDKPQFNTADARRSGLIYPPTEVVCQVCHNAKSPFFGTGYLSGTLGWQKLGTHEHFKLKHEHGR